MKKAIGLRLSLVRILPLTELLLLVQPIGAVAKTSAALRVSTPANGAIVHGQVRVVAKGRPQASVVVFYADGATIGNTPPFAATWNSSGASAGLHILKVVAYASSGNVLASAQNAVFTVTGVAITTPINGTTASGTLNVTCVAAAKTRRVDLSLDGTHIASSPPLTFQIASPTCLWAHRRRLRRPPTSTTTLFTPPQPDSTSVLRELL